MAIAKIYNNNTQAWDELIRGVKGDTGDTGLHIGDTPPTDLNKLWVDTGFEGYGDLYAPAFYQETFEKTADYTIQLEDTNKIVVMNIAGPGTVTVPLNATVEFPIGSVVGIYNISADLIAVEGEVGVTVRNAGFVSQYTEVSLRKRAENEWVLMGAS